ncbi:c-type cytochrome [Chelativorans xinjiangense]|uniref:c-type cytochrome n=1 Tax=Chelativorans xinjiangense TaxID=2681485 RepID=UPI00135B5B46|nr:c-type cytochrome [Chelativorans xinjiangense]
MARLVRGSLTISVMLAALAMTQPANAHGSDEHAASPETDTMVGRMREMHEGHEHGHDFAAIESMAPEDMQRVIRVMTDIGLAVPPMDAHRGRELFMAKGCVACHQVNDVGGEIGPALNAADMPSPMNAFEFAARMWRGAGAMVGMQQELLGEQINLTGQELLNLVAFAHDEAEQREVSKDDIPAEFREFTDY